LCDEAGITRDAACGADNDDTCGVDNDDTHGADNETPKEKEKPKETLEKKGIKYLDYEVKSIMIVEERTARKPQDWTKADLEMYYGRVAEFAECAIKELMKKPKLTKAESSKLNMHMDRQKVRRPISSLIYKSQTSDFFDLTSPLLRDQARAHEAVTVAKGTQLKSNTPKTMTPAATTRVADKKRKRKDLNSKMDKLMDACFDFMARASATPNEAGASMPQAVAPPPPAPIPARTPERVKKARRLLRSSVGLPENPKLKADVEWANEVVHEYHASLRDG